MPAFGDHHSEEEITALTVFVSALPGLSGEEYARLTGEAPHDEGKAHHN